jgi:hypothetical protein
MTLEISLQQSIGNLSNYSPKQQVEILLKQELAKALSELVNVHRIPIAPLLDSIRRITGKEDEADTCMEYIRSKIGEERCAEIGRIGDDDANYIIIYPRNQKPADFRKSKTNALTVVELVKVAIFTLDNQVKPYQTVCGVKVTRSNLNTARDIANVIRDALPSIKILNFANKYSVKQLDNIINLFGEIKRDKERAEMICVLKERGFTEDQIARLSKPS